MFKVQMFNVGEGTLNLELLSFKPRGGGDFELLTRNF